MCGILNIINKKKKKLDLSLCRRAMAKLHNRGPDKKLFYSPEPHIFLGQTVLSLVGDIETSTSDFLWSPSKNYYLSFNGEIYNYKELSKDILKEDILLNDKVIDTEVLVKLHDNLNKKDIPQKLDGMFAYSVFDREKNEIFYSRDFQGEKTLYIYEDEDQIILSSQIDAIKVLVEDLEIDIDVLKDYFFTRHLLQQERVAYKNVRQLGTGCLEVLNLNTMSVQHIQKNTCIELISKNKMDLLASKTIEELTDELDQILSKCVKEMVPNNRSFASVLSGGIDSSLLSAYACEHGNPDVLVAVNHVGKDEISLDLTGFEESVEKKVTILNVNKEIYASEINRSISVLCSPLLSHSFIGQNLQSAYVSMMGCKALFGGEGADELFGGYECYLEPQLFSDTCPSLYSGFFKPEIELFDHDTYMLESELSKGWKSCLEAYSFLDDKKTQVLHAQMLCDLTMQVSNVAMRGADLMSLIWGLETRSIFMRKPVIEFALNLPIWAKLDFNNPNPLLKTKNILKRVFLKYFPDNLIVNKQGFSGFPNESKEILGDVKDFLALKLLGIDESTLSDPRFDRNLEWKLINIEHFIRSH
ncbi:MAG: asparagine synthase (glutamine-hydrolyzing) [Bacteriovoracaceae bacterium]|jgi:asparagine synthase (glutamine-hydrolysing)